MRDNSGVEARRFESRRVRSGQQAASQLGLVEPQPKSDLVNFGLKI